MGFLLTPHHVLIKILIHHCLVLISADVHYLASTQLIHSAARPPTINDLQAFQFLRTTRSTPIPLFSINRELIKVLELGHNPHNVVHMILVIEVHLEVPHVRHVLLNLLPYREIYVLDQVVSEIQTFDGESWL